MARSYLFQDCEFSTDKTWLASKLSPKVMGPLGISSVSHGLFLQLGVCKLPHIGCCFWIDWENMLVGKKQQSLSPLSLSLSLSVSWKMYHESESQTSDFFELQCLTGWGKLQQMFRAPHLCQRWPLTATTVFYQPVQLFLEWLTCGALTLGPIVSFAFLFESVHGFTCFLFWVLLMISCVLFSFGIARHCYLFEDHSLFVQQIGKLAESLTHAIERSRNSGFTERKNCCALITQLETNESRQNDFFFFEEKYWCTVRLVEK